MEKLFVYSFVVLTICMPVIQGILERKFRKKIKKHKAELLFVLFILTILKMIVNFFWAVSVVFSYGTVLWIKLILFLMFCVEIVFVIFYSKRKKICAKNMQIIIISHIVVTLFPIWASFLFLFFTGFKAFFTKTERTNKRFN